MLDGLKNSKLYPLVQRALRVLQFLSAFSSLVVFSLRIRRLPQYTNALSHSNGAVEGILVAAVMYTLGVMIVTFLLKRANSHTSNMLRWFLVLMDVLFVGAFTGVAVLTRPNGGSAGPCRAQLGSNFGGRAGEAGCKLPLGTFITAIISTILHALTAIFQNIREKRRTAHNDTLNGKNNNNNYPMEGRDSATLHGRESTNVPNTGHHTGIGHNNGVGHGAGPSVTGAGYNNAAHDDGTYPVTGGSHYNRGSNAV